MANGRKETVGLILFDLLMLSGCAAGRCARHPFTECAELLRLMTLTPRPTATTRPADSGWQTIVPGVEYRELSIKQGDRSDRLRIARVDPAQANFRVLYNADRPQRVSEWLTESNALLAVNGDLFDPQNRALSLVVQDGRAIGAPYEGLRRDVRSERRWRARR